MTAQSVQRELFFLDLWFQVSKYNERGKNVKKKLNSLNNTLEEGKTLIQSTPFIAEIVGTSN